MEAMPGKEPDREDRRHLIYSFYGPVPTLARLEQAVHQPCAKLDSLLYAALEARLLLEGTVLALSFVYRNGEISKSESKAYGVKNHERSLREIAPEIEKVLHFASIYVEVAGRQQALAIPDFQRMNQYYGKIGGYLHSKLANWEGVQREDFGVELWKLLRAIYDEVEPVVRGGFATVQLNDRGKELLDRFLRGEAGEEQVRKELAGSFWPRPEDGSR